MRLVFNGSMVAGIEKKESRSVDDDVQPPGPS